MKTDAFSIILVPSGHPQATSKFSVLAGRPKSINFKLEFQSKSMILDPRAPGADFEDLTGHLRKLEKP